MTTSWLAVIAMDLRSNDEKLFYYFIWECSVEMISVVTMVFLDFVTIHWNQWVQTQSFGEKCIGSWLFLFYSNSIYLDPLRSSDNGNIEKDSLLTFTLMQMPFLLQRLN